MPGPLITVNRVRHALAVSIGRGQPDTDPAGLGLPLAVARELHGASRVRAPEVATAASRPAARRKPRARVRG
ncbi:hypothetical protein GCM10010277_51310 [Streptomyces longisporoflavus]|uniref:hypothetical protein n=1 Tax=Streptomyces longisporoflavus TaxID=28044 RepID=UPI00167CD0D4|nr:hypothetical protein [Streptomyces longisporoflavus]GGV53568.1 hypothetical protein GCM10010277_51310 [Streptomyces longisporoflavus]